MSLSSLARPLSRISTVCLQMAFMVFAAAQPQASQSEVLDGKSYARVHFVDGLPKNQPVKRVNATKTSFATVTLADTLGTLYVCALRDSSGHWRYSLLLHLHSGGWDVARLTMSEDSLGFLQTSYDLRPLAGRPISYPVDLRIRRDREYLLFRWKLSPEVAGTPGGDPTPTSAFLDLGKPIFGFTVRELSGKEVRSSSLKGRPSVVNWWNTRCTPCIQELKGLNELARKYQGRVEFLAIALDTLRNVQKFLTTREFLFRQTVAADSMWEYIGGTVPRTVVLNKEGVVTFYLAGGSEDTYKQVESAIEQTIKNQQ